MTSLADVFEGRARWAVLPCDCRFGMLGMPADGIDAIVTDPPYELGFMGKGWDASGIAFDVNVWREALRVAKPGAHLVAFGGTRTYHRMTCAIEDAGWEIRDSLCWLYGQAMPHSHNVSKAIDKAAGVEKGGTYAAGVSSRGAKKEIALTGPATSEWDGWGTNLKPGFEPIVLARKPFSGTVEENVRRYGTGALNINGCRIPSGPDHAEKCASVVGLSSARTRSTYGTWRGERTDSWSPNGRWPPNVLLDEAAAEVLDAQSGERASGIAVTRNGGGCQIFGSKNRMGAVPDSGYADSGGASRFFYTAKASRSERDAGLEYFEDRDGVKNDHPTVKPDEVIRWLVRLTCRGGGLVLDPFTGSGTTGRAVMREGEGRRFVGLELDPLYVDFARGRIVHVIGGDLVREISAPRASVPQLGLFDRGAP